MDSVQNSVYQYLEENGLNVDFTAAIQKHLEEHGLDTGPIGETLQHLLTVDTEQYWGSQGIATFQERFFKAVSDGVYRAMKEIQK